MINEATSLKSEPIAGRNVYVDLDSLFDTRLAILEKIDSRYATLIYEAGFNNRTEDAFPNLNKEDFKYLFEQRNNEILGASLLTGIFSMVKNHILENLDKMAITPGGSEVKVVVNLWPYDFDQNDKEGINLILKPIYDISPDRIKVDAINIDPKKIPTTFFGNGFAFLVMYDYMRWLSNILDDPKTAKTPMGKTTLIAPKLYLGETLNEKELQEILDAGTFDPFRQIELVCAPYIGLEFFDLPIFCALLTPDFIQKRKVELGIAD